MEVVERRASHPSRAQIETLLDFLEKNPALAKGFARAPCSRVGAVKKWDKFTVALNSMEGSLKSRKQWTKYWADKKNAVKKKAVLCAAERLKTSGGEVDEAVELTDIEERILALMNGEHNATGDSHIGNQPSQTSESPSFMNTKDIKIEVNLPMGINPEEAVDNTDGVIALSPLNLKHTVRPVPVSRQIPLALNSVTSGHYASGTSYGSNKPSFVLESQPEPSPPEPAPTASPPPGSLSPPQSGSTQLDISRESSPITLKKSPSPDLKKRSRRGRKRRLISPPGLSNRRSQLLSLTDRFIRMEQQRMALDRKNIQVLETVTNLVRQLLERDADREHAVAQGLSSIGQGLKLLAGALDK